jgi:hypothetical protein
MAVDQALWNPCRRAAARAPALCSGSRHACRSDGTSHRAASDEPVRPRRGNRHRAPADGRARGAPRFRADLLRARAAPAFRRAARGLWRDQCALVGGLRRLRRSAAEQATGRRTRAAARQQSPASRRRRTARWWRRAGSWWAAPSAASGGPAPARLDPAGGLAGSRPEPARAAPGSVCCRRRIDHARRIDRSGAGHRRCVCGGAARIRAIVRHPSCARAAGSTRARPRTGAGPLFRVRRMDVAAMTADDR